MARQPKSTETPTRSRRTTSATRSARTGRKETTREKPGKPAEEGASHAAGVRIRMYRLGHGDCFLLTFRDYAAEPVHVLIDCGYKPGSNEKYGLKPIDEIVAHIHAETKGQLDLVIVTHEHQDHLNGFWKSSEPYFGNFNIKAAWFAWTESRDDEVANELRRRHHDQLLGLIAARQQMAAAGDGDGADRVREFIALEWGADDIPETFGAAPKDPEASVNKQGMKLIKDKAGKANTSFIYPFKDILRLPGVASGVRVFALGPPRNPELLDDTDPTGADSFPDMRMASPSSMFEAARALSGGFPAGQLAPFSQRYQIPFADKQKGAPGDVDFRSHAERSRTDSDAAQALFFRDFYGEGPDTVIPRNPEEVPDGGSWRRIDKDWLNSAEELALYLNEGVNNTSLVLAFELETSGKVLLFAGDAQHGNWLSWTDGKWKDGAGVEIDAKNLLSRTVLYKVGHHGSHNATLNGTSESAYANLAWMGHGKYAGEFTAMITAVKEWAYNVKPKPWRHPLDSIKKALEVKCEGRIFQTDTDTFSRPKDMSEATWQAFLSRVHVDPERVYFDYWVPDQ